MKNLLYLLVLIFCFSCTGEIEIETTMNVTLNCENGELSFDGDLSCLDNGFYEIGDIHTLITLNYINQENVATTVEIKYVTDWSNRRNSLHPIHTVFKRENFVCSPRIGDDGNMSFTNEFGKFSFTFNSKGGTSIEIIGSYANLEDFDDGLKFRSDQENHLLL